MQVYHPFARPANQDRRYFPLDASKVREISLEEEWRKKNERLEKSLTEMLGSNTAARAYMRSRDYLAGCW